MRNSFQFLIILAAVTGLALGITPADGAFCGGRRGPAAASAYPAPARRARGGHAPPARGPRHPERATPPPPRPAAEPAAAQGNVVALLQSGGRGPRCAVTTIR